MRLIALSTYGQGRANKSNRINIVFLSTVLLLLAGLNSSQAATLTADEIESEHQRGVEQARAGKYDQGLATLRTLLPQATFTYLVIRDIVIIHTWKEDYPEALRQYESIQDQPEQETYLIGSISHCLNQLDHQSEAIEKLTAA